MFVVSSCAHRKPEVNSRELASVPTLLDLETEQVLRLGRESLCSLIHCACREFFVICFYLVEFKGVVCLPLSSQPLEYLIMLEISVVNKYLLRDMKKIFDKSANYINYMQIICNYMHSY